MKNLVNPIKSSKIKKIHSNEDSHHEDFVGRRVSGYFRSFQQYYSGTVIKVIRNKQFQKILYRIHYDDGDEEDVYYLDEKAEDGRDLFRMLQHFQTMHGQDSSFESKSTIPNTARSSNSINTRISSTSSKGAIKQHKTKSRGKSPGQPPPPPEEDARVTTTTSIGSNANVRTLSKDSDVIVNTNRTSGRKRILTTVTVGSYTVLAKNNYSVRGIGGYVFDTQPRDVAKPTSREPPQKVPKTNTEESKKPRHRSKAESERMEHNQQIKDKMKNDAMLRNAYLASKLDVLSPFLESKVQSYLQSHVKTDRDSVSLRQNFTLQSQPDIVTTTLRDYQMLGVEWMIQNHKCGLPMILGDEMGLGKTIQTLCFLAYLKETNQVKGPSLIVVPLSVLYSWGNEIQSHASSLTHFRLHSIENERRVVLKDLNERFMEYDVIVTTYDMLKTAEVKIFLMGVYFNYIVLDEGHIIKNIDSLISGAVRRGHCQNKLILTGTPLQNNLVELYAILNFLCPSTFTEPRFFREAFDIGSNSIDPDMLLKANKLLNIFMLRRLKEEVEKLMPKKIETKVLCPLSSSQIFWYKGFLMNEIDFLIKATEDASDDTSSNQGNRLRNLIMQLRKMCLHPFLFKFAESNPGQSTVQELLSSSGKLAVLDMLLQSLFTNGHRTVIFSQFTGMLDILEDYCILRGWNFCRFDGGTPRSQRNYLIKRFNAPGSDLFIFLMSTRSGGLGINLQTADTCILYDSDWNPQPDLQAMARVHRIGQKKTVHVYRLVSCGTVEERVLERAEKKLYLDQMVNRGSSQQFIENESESGLSRSDLLQTLKFGSNAVFSSSNNLPTEQDISILTDRNRSEEDSIGILQGGITSTAQSFDKDKKLSDTQTFEGINFRVFRDANAKQSEWKEKKGKLLDSLKIEWAGLLHDESEEEKNRGKGKRVRKSRVLQIDGLGSGYGTASVPVLASNNYDLESGEPSVWTETKRKVTTPSINKIPKEPKFLDNQDFCQVCGDGGYLILCPDCPVSVHEECCGMKAKEFLRCSHHRCRQCNRNATNAGGLLFRCQNCPSSFCEDCLPDGFQIIDGVGRFEVFGLIPDLKFVYIYCNPSCERNACWGYEWKPKKKEMLRSPAKIDVSYAFGPDALSVKEIASKHAMMLSSSTKKTFLAPFNNTAPSLNSSDKNSHFKENECTQANENQPPNMKSSVTSSADYGDAVSESSDDEVVVHIKMFSISDKFFKIKKHTKMTKLFKAYAQMNSLDVSSLVFLSHPNQDVITNDATPNSLRMKEMKDDDEISNMIYCEQR